MTPRKQRRFLHKGKFSKRRISQQGESIWRARIQASIVDLRHIKKDKRARHSGSTVGLEPIKNIGATRKTLPDNYYLNEYANELLSIRKIFPVTHNHPDNLPSREELLADLARMVSQDLDPYMDNGFVAASMPSASKTDLAHTDVGSDKRLPKSIISFQASDTSKFSPPKHDEILRDSSRNGSGILRISPSKGVIIAALVLMFTLGSIGAIAARVLAVKDDVMIHTERALVHMRNGRSSLKDLDAESARVNFQAAQEEFLKIEHSVSFASSAIINLAIRLPLQSLSSGAHLFKAGKLFADVGYEASVALMPLEKARLYNSSSAEGMNFTDSVVESVAHMTLADDYLEQANNELARVNPKDVPAQFREDFFLLQKQSAAVELLLSKAFSSTDIILQLLGHENPQHYLLLFQNSSELRPTGGFIGTYGFLTLFKGKIENLLIDGIYNPDGQLSVNVIPPKPLQYVTDKWGTRDSNWFFDFPTSAQKAIWFYERTGGATPDGVIAFTPAVLENLLELVGPVDMPAYGLTLNSDNFLELIQKEVEDDYDRILNRPKQILTDLSPVLIERVEALSTKTELLDILLKALNRKDIMLYSRNYKIQSLISSHHWDGAITNTDRQDYMAVVISNLGGAKADKVTQTDLTTKTDIDSEGNIIRTITVKRTHNGGRTDFRWYNKPNVSYIKFYVPQGATLISARGFSQSPPLIQTDYDSMNFQRDPLLIVGDATTHIYSDFAVEKFLETGRTVFGGWFIVKPQKFHEAQLSYKLSSPVQDKNYILTIQKQAGVDVNLFGEVHSAKLCDSKEQNFTDSFSFVLRQDVTLHCLMQ